MREPSPVRVQLQRFRTQSRSGTKFGVIAAGEGDMYPRFGTTM
jgi:3'-phosphoadenosine 5'-phosphosulfate (PAPS) 3'-phosphatase